jgi:hypothetical protein
MDEKRQREQTRLVSLDTIALDSILFSVLQFVFAVRVHLFELRQCIIFLAEKFHLKINLNYPLYVSDTHRILGLVFNLHQKLYWRHFV